MTEPDVPTAEAVDMADVSPGLIEGINHLFDEYGPLGVEKTVIAMRARMTT